MDKSVLEYVSEVTEFNDISEFMNDKDVDKALGYVVKLISKPEISVATAPRLIVELQALSAKFSMLAMYYTNIEPGKAGTEQAKRKNVYYKMNNMLNDLVAALKYMTK